MHYFSQMTWPGGFFIFSQLPNHLHKSLVGPLYHPIYLGLVGHGTQLLHAKGFTHFINNVAHEVCTVIILDPGWGPKDQNVTLIQKLGNCLCGLVRGHICHNILCEVVLEHQDIGDLRWSVCLHGHLDASKIHM